MATAIPSQMHGPGMPDGADRGDPRVAAFCSARHPDLFHAFAYAADIWRHDPFDVESIHRGARDKFAHIVGRVREPSGLPRGRILLLLGESGSGKTHIMRAFRNQVHSRDSGYCGYLQMTAFTEQYVRYVLNNLLDSFDKPYDESRSATTALIRLSSALAESCGDAMHHRLQSLQDGGLAQTALDHTITEMADQIILDDRFRDIPDELFVVQALLYLQSSDPRIKARVLRYLRCEDLTAHDRTRLGGIIPCNQPDAPHRMIQRLGQLIWAVERVPLVLCVDQLEDVFDLDSAAVKFRRAMATLCDIVSRLPSAIVVIACLENFYDELRKLLTRPIVDRVENDPAPVALQAPCDRDEVDSLIARRLRFLYDSAGVSFVPDEPTFPLPETLIRKLVGLRARDVLGEVHRYRERCVEEGKMTECPFPAGCQDGPKPAVGIIPLEQAWNEFRSTFVASVSVDDQELAAILTEAIRSCAEEVLGVATFEAETDGRLVSVKRCDIDQYVERMLVGVCNKAAPGGGLSRQIDEVVKRAGADTPVIVRSTEFPRSPQAAVVQQLGRLVADGGRRVVIEDSDWRAMMALSSFRGKHGSDARFASWLKVTHPLTSLTSLREILNLTRKPDRPLVVLRESIPP
jgi:chloramphenicol 3-O-phosphotransferase